LRLRGQAARPRTVEVADDRELLALAEVVDGLALGPDVPPPRRISELLGGRDRRCGGS